MICAEATAVIERPPREILEFVLDFEQYRKADKKVGPVSWARRDGDEGEALVSGMIGPVPTPPARLTWKLTPWSRLELRTKAGLPPEPIAGFRALFTCGETSDGTRLLHRECFFLPSPLEAVARPLVLRWLEESVTDEVVRMKEMLEAGTP